MRHTTTIPVEERSAILREAIAMSGLSARQFAMQVALRSERTIRHWLAGAGPIPMVFAEQMQRRIDAGDVTRTP